ncbi:MAG: hypothetical protein IJY90_03090 [Clostridia bacterium]|nr:hypothetical protein [Clostridia bacterium]
MNHRYKKFLELQSEHISAESIKNKTFCSQEEATVIYKNLLEDKIVDNGKVVDLEKFNKVAQHRFYFDIWHEIETSLFEIVKYVLFKDERFIKLISKELNLQLSLTSCEKRIEFLGQVDDQVLFKIELKAIEFLNNIKDNVLKLTKQ